MVAGSRSPKRTVAALNLGRARLEREDAMPSLTSTAQATSIVRARFGIAEPWTSAVNMHKAMFNRSWTSANRSIATTSAGRVRFASDGAPLQNNPRRVAAQTGISHETTTKVLFCPHLTCYNANQRPETRLRQRGGRRSSPFVSGVLPAPQEQLRFMMPNHPHGEVMRCHATACVVLTIRPSIHASTHRPHY